MNDFNPQREDRWHRIIVPMARGLEGFFWRIAWFALFVTILFYSARRGG